MTTLRALSLAALASRVLAHVDINFPLGTWTHTEEQQETGAFCGGGSRGSAYSWGTQEPFVSLSGDAGQSVRVLLATTNSTTANTTVSSASSFPIVLVENATFSDSGNLCLPVDLSSYITGAHATIYVEATGDDESVSSCADVVLVPAKSGNAPVIDHGSSVINAQTGSAYTTREYYCSNSTIAALDACSCHCHGTSEHCDASCSSERIAQAATECAAGTSSSSSDHSEEDGHDHSSETGTECECHCHGTEEHCGSGCPAESIATARAQCAAGEAVVIGASSSATPSSATGTVAAAAAASSQPVSGATRNAIGAGALLMGAGIAFLA